jgi:hypothetical protein
MEEKIGEGEFKKQALQMINDIESTIKYHIKEFGSDGGLAENGCCSSGVQLVQFQILIAALGVTLSIVWLLIQHRSSKYVLYYKTQARKYAKKTSFLVPFHAYSGGTLLCFSGNRIDLGGYAVLGPIDITVGGIELASIDYFMNFAERCRENIERMLGKVIQDRANVPSPIVNPTPCSEVECALLVEMVKQVGALNVGRFFRERTLTGHYAFRLLHDYMFGSEPNKKSLSENISNQILFEFPSHDFDMDYHICKELGLPVFEMTETESDKTKSLVNKLDALSENDVICRRITDTYKSPFFRLYTIGGQNNGKPS